MFKLKFAKMSSTLDWTEVHKEKIAVFQIRNVCEVDSYE